MNLRCIKHPKYDGKANPDLECRNCCKMFLQEKRSQAPLVRERAERLARVGETINKVNKLMATLRGDK